MENRNGLIVDLVVERATGTAERDVALDMLDSLGGSRSITLAADKGYDTRGFVAERHATQGGCTRGAEQEREGPISDRRAHGATSRIRSQSTRAKADRGDIRVDEDDGRQ